MLTKLKGLSTQAKVAVGAALAALLAVGIGVAVWQPWNQPAEEPPQEPDNQQQEPVTPQEPEDEKLSVKVNGEDVPCTLYEGDGWSVYVPEGWDAAPATGDAPATGQKGAVFTSPDGAEMQMDFRQMGGVRGQPFQVVYEDGDNKVLQFCGMSGGNTPVLTCSAPKSQWNRYEKLFAALQKTAAIEADTYFSEVYVLPQEPDWQEAEGYTVLFLEKDGIILDDEAQAAVEEHMRTWPAEDQTVYTGQYRINSIDWAADYTGLSDGYVDVFRLRVQYRVAEGGEEALKTRDGVTVVDGWASLPENVNLVYDHSSGEFRTVVTPDTVDWTGFVEYL